ncbi:MAG: dihydrolipoamide acetyltransferase family protein [Rhodoglobus sp.]
MASIVRMPGVSADSEEATLIEWSINTGDQIRAGESLAVVETEKANVDIEADGDGTLWRTLAEPGDSVTVGNPIAVLLASGEDASAGESLLASLGFGAAPPTTEPSAPTPALPAADPAPAPAAAPVPAAVEAVAAPAVEWTRVFSSPLARRLAQQSGVAIESIAGTGPGGRIVRADVERAAEAPAASPPVEVASPQVTKPAPSSGGYTDTPHSGLRRAVANALTSSKRDAPHFYLTTTCRVDALMALRADILAQSAQKVSINDLFIKAVGTALRAVPEMNVIWTPDAVRQFDAVDVSVAIASDKGLVTPVLRNVDTLSVSQISSQVRDFVERANAGRLKQHELEGGAFTISNLGMFGVEQFGAIINPPQVAILAVGAAVSVPLVVDGEIVVGTTVTVTVSVDHRPVDGVIAARWLASLRGFIEHPLTMLV